MNKTYTIKEYNGDSGDIKDSFGSDLTAYTRTVQEIADTIDKIIPKLG